MYVLFPKDIMISEGYQSKQSIQNKIQQSVLLILKYIHK